jgi:hypothetical protein
MIITFINNIIKFNKYIFVFMILFLVLYLLYKNSCYKKENFQEKKTSKNINTIHVPNDFIATHPFTNSDSGLNLIDNPQEHYIYENDKKSEKFRENKGYYTKEYGCRPSITGVFTDCGPYSFNSCEKKTSKLTHHTKNTDKKYRKHINYKDYNDIEPLLTCDKNICHYIYHYYNNDNNKKHNDKKHNDKKHNDKKHNDKKHNDKKNNNNHEDNDNSTLLNYDEYIDNLDGY